MKKYLFVSLFVTILLSSIVLADMPKYITVQGILTQADGSPISVSSANFRFRIYNDYTAGSQVWPSPAGTWETINNVKVDSNGMFNVELGKSVPLSIGFNDPYFLYIEVDVGAGFKALNPRVNITSSGYAFAAGRLLPTSYNIIPTSNRTYDIGDSTHFWKDIYLSGKYGTGTGIINNVFRVNSPPDEDMWIGLMNATRTIGLADYVNGVPIWMYNGSKGTLDIERPIVTPYIKSPKIADVNKNGFVNAEDIVLMTWAWAYDQAYDCQNWQPCWIQQIGYDSLTGPVYYKDLDIDGNSNLDILDVIQMSDAYNFSTILPGTVLKKVCDINKDGKVDYEDAYFIYKSFGCVNASATCTDIKPPFGKCDCWYEILGVDFNSNYIFKKNADLDDDGKVNILDTIILSGRFGQYADYAPAFAAISMGDTPAGTFINNDSETGMGSVSIFDTISIERRFGNENPNVGSGSAIQFVGRTVGSTLRDMSKIATVWTDVIDATRKSAITFSTVDNGILAARVNISSSGIINAVGVNGQQLCIAGDCRNSWPSGSGGGNGWAVSSYVYNDTANTRVGIGTNNPRAPLEIYNHPTTTNNNYGLWVDTNRTVGNSYGIYSKSTSYGSGFTSNYGISGYATGGFRALGVYTEAVGLDITGDGISDTDQTYGVYGRARNGITSNYGIYGIATGNLGTKYALYGNATGLGINWGLYVESGNAYIDGNLQVVGTLTKGAGSFLIDHPLDPMNKTLQHSFVESPEMMNIYKGRAKLENGEATIIMPEWFQALNGDNQSDYEYSLTPIGSFCQLAIKKGISNNKFTVMGNKNCEFSWIVYAVRHDPYAEAHRIVVEQEKTNEEKGKCIHPETCELFMK